MEVTIELPIGTRIEETKALGLEIEERIRKEIPSIETISMSVGQASDGDAWASVRDNGTNVITMYVGQYKTLRAYTDTG